MKVVFGLFLIFTFAISTMAQNGSPDEYAVPIGQTSTETKVKWGGVMKESLLFLGIMHGFRVAAEPNTRYHFTHGKFFGDWFKAARELRGWKDGDNVMTNYVGHPFQGSVSCRIFVQNDPKGAGLMLDKSPKYLKSRLKAFTYSTLFSLQFELGLLSEAAIGNNPRSPRLPHPTSYVDLVITPVLGTTWLVGEDALDKYLVLKLEDKYSNKRWVAWVARSFLNPSRSFANVLRFKHPWYRESRR